MQTIPLSDLAAVTGAKKKSPELLAYEKCARIIKNDFPLRGWFQGPAVKAEQLAACGVRPAK